ncbi:large repetitive protein [Amycolatopsis coloradensis]|uniref:Large repetitive protein n=1 Tax=Amycolatopsis coloradensis TaxID=76021 RepID=A0ACD5BDP2_9PSEU
MSESTVRPTLVGQYAVPAPVLDPAYFSTLESLESAVSDLVNAADGSATTAWYELEKDIKAAEVALASVNEKFAKQIKAVGDALEGDTGEAFRKYATAILDTSEQVYDTLMGKQFGTNMGNIGRAIQNFVTTWWQLQKIGKEVYEQRVSALRADTQRKIQAAESTAEIAAHTANLATGLVTIKTTSDAALLKDLQNALGTLGSAYNARAADLVPLYISDGDTTTAAPQDSYQAQAGQPQPEQQQTRTAYLTKVPDRRDQPVSQQPTQTGDAEQQTPGDPTASQNNAELASGAQPDSGLKPSLEAVPTESAVPGSVTPGLTPATGGSDGLGGPGQANGSQAGGVSPEAQAALGDAKQAAGDAIDDLTSQTEDPARKEALQDAKEAAQGAIDGLTDGAPGGETGGSAGTEGGLDPGAGAGAGAGVGGGLGSPMPGLADAKKAAGKAIDELGKKTDDPKRQQALEDAKKAAEDAIDGLTSPTAPGALTGGPGEPSADEAKEAVGGAIDDLAKAGDSEARQQALEDAKKAASDAVDGITGGGTGAEMQDAAGKAIDDLIGGTDDPERKAALEEAKNAANDAIDKMTPPDLGDAKQAAQDAIGDLARPGDTEARQQALDDAKNAASDAVDGILGQDGTDPAAAADRAQLLDAKEAAGKAIDDLIGDTDDPERKTALEDAKDAMSSAIDEMAAPEHFQQVQDAKLAAERAIDGLGTSSDDAQRQQALDAAKSAANEAIDRINDSPDLTGPEHDQALAQAREDAAKAIDGLARPDDTPAERQELADAKAAANRAIDAIGGAQGGSGGGSAMRDFLEPSAPGQGNVAGGAGAGGAPATAGGPPPGKFDTQPLSAGAPVNTQGGPPLSAVPGGLGAGQQGGMPMGPMGGAPMGGGGAGGGQGEKEREPQIWIQAEQGAWGENDDSQNPVLGKN